jgi:hypothetical protein
MKNVAAIGLVAATLFTAGDVSAFAIRGSVIASGGSNSARADNATQQVIGTAGQPAVGECTGGGSVCSGFWSFGRSRAVTDGPRGRDMPKMFSFALISSNPTRGPAQFELALPKPSRMTLRVYDVSGRLVGDPLELRFEAGRHRVTWGADLRRSGVYFVRLTSEVGFSVKRKITLVR